VTARKDATMEFPMPVRPRVGVVKRIVRWVILRFPRGEHLHKDCPGYDHEDADYCCTYCECCPCYSWRCNLCVWSHKLKWIGDWAWK